MEGDQPATPHGDHARRLPWLLIGLVGLSFLIRLALAGRVGVMSEEAYYWNYAQRPSFGYFDHPPGVAWMIWCAAAVFGRSDFALRVGPLFCAAVSSMFLFLVARARWDDRRAGWRTVLLFNALPIFVGIGFFAFPDAPLVAGWTAAVYFGMQAVATGRGRWWLLWGVGVGVALLAKYYAGALLIGAAAFALASARGRTALRRPGPYLGVVLALLIFSPVIWWNSQHAWASFRFQLLGRTGGAAHVNILQFIGYQLIGVTPVLFGFLLLVAGRGVRSADERDRWLAWQFWPMFAAFTLYSFKSQVHLNWVAPAYLSVLPLAQQYCASSATGPAACPVGWRRAAAWSVGATAAVMLYLFLQLGGWLPAGWMPALIARPLANRFEWVAFAQALERVEDEVARQRGARPFRLATDKYYLASQMAYLGDAGDWQDTASRNLLGGKALAWGFWNRPADFVGRDAVIVAANTRSLADANLARFFERLGPVRPLLDPTREKVVRQSYYRIGYGYRPAARE